MFILQFIISLVFIPILLALPMFLSLLVLLLFLFIKFVKDCMFSNGFLVCLGSVGQEFFLRIGLRGSLRFCGKDNACWWGLSLFLSFMRILFIGIRIGLLMILLRKMFCGFLMGCSFWVGKLYIVDLFWAFVEINKLFIHDFFD